MYKTVAHADDNVPFYTLVMFIPEFLRNLICSFADYFERADDRISQHTVFTEILKSHISEEFSRF